MKVAVIGARGQLGSDLIRALGKAGRYDIAPLSHSEVDVTSPDRVSQALVPIRPDVVVNCAAFHRVDDCEREPELAFSVNALGCLNVARVCEELDAVTVFVSSDYVFDGDNAPYSEEDAVAPVNVYGASKVAGEQMLRQTCRRSVVVRVASLFGVEGASGKGGNFVETILSSAKSGKPLNVVDDIRMSPTYATDAACALERILADGAEGTFHLTNEGAATWYELARAVLQTAGIKTEIRPTSSSSAATVARRPRDSSLISERTPRSARQFLRPWPDALRDYLFERGHISSAA